MKARNSSRVVSDRKNELNDTFKRIKLIKK